jgi:two-component system NtrC family sensor kinase
MSIARKIALLVYGPIALLLLVNMGNRVERELELFESDLKKDQRALVRALVSLADDLAARESAERVHTLVLEAGAVARMNVSIMKSEDVLARQLFTDADRDRLMRGRVLTRFEIDDDDQERIATSQSFAMPDGSRHVITVTSSLSDRDAYVSSTVTRFLLTLALMLITAFVVAWIVGDRLVGRPVSALLADLRRVGDGDLSVRIAHGQRDELGEIGAEMNRTIEKLDLARQALQRETSSKLEMVEQLRHAERLATVGQLASGLAHELGTPLHVIASRARRIRADQKNDGRAQGEAEIIVDETGRMKRIVEQLLTFARRGPPTRADVDLAALADQAGTLLLPMLKKSGCRLMVQAAPGVDTHASVDDSALLQVFTNLVLNAIHAMPDGGLISVSLARRGRDTLEISVADEGTGMSPEVRARAFEPFFTTKAVGTGTGLGLSVVYGIIQDHGGSIRIEPHAPHGCVVTFTLPVLSSENQVGSRVPLRATSRDDAPMA